MLDYDLTDRFIPHEQHVYAGPNSRRFIEIPQTLTNQILSDVRLRTRVLHYLFINVRQY